MYQGAIKMTTKTTPKNLKNTGERMIPEYSHGKLMYAEHMVRYKAALDFIDQRVVLDIASGSGYGTKLLAEKAKYVYGVDVDVDSVEYSNREFAGKNIEFLVGDAVKIPLEDNSVDVVVTFETIEHVKKYEIFLKEIDRVLKKDGLLLISTPNSLEFSEGNHFHLHEFEYKELIGLLKPTFEYIDSYFQGTWKSTIIGTKDFVGSVCSEKVYTDNFAPLDESKILYFFLVCSKNNIIKKLKPISGIGEHYSDKDNSNAWLESGAHINRLQNEAKVEIDRLNAINNEFKSQINNLNKQILDIHNSKTYKLSKNLSNTKNKIIRN